MAFLGMLSAAIFCRAQEPQEKPILPELAEHVVLKVNGVPISQEMLASSKEWEVQGNLQVMRVNYLFPRLRDVMHCTHAKLSISEGKLLLYGMDRWHREMFCDLKGWQYCYEQPAYFYAAAYLGSEGKFVVHSTRPKTTDIPVPSPGSEVDHGGS